MTYFASHELERVKMQLQLLYSAVHEEIVARLHPADSPESLMLTKHLLDGGDCTAADVENDTDIALLRQKLNELCDIEDALKRIQARTFGICIHCGEWIPKARMKAQITSKYCMHCLRDAQVKSSL